MDTSRRLDSWKEIAEYVGRDVRTAIRWERQRGLPVHRVPGGRRGAVFAYAPEIDRWRSGPVSPRGDATPGETNSPAPARAAAGRSWLSLVLGLVVLAVVAGSVAALVPGGLHVPRGRSIARVRYERHEIQVLDDAGQRMWSHAFDLPLDVELMSQFPSPRWVVVDLEGDGPSELVVTVTRMVASEIRQDELYCFSEAGAVRWRVKLDDVVHFRGGTFGPPWSDGFVAAFRSAGEARIAWSQNSPPSWPSLVVAFDGAGRRLGTFIHSGSTNALSAFDGPDGPLVVGGGVSNSSRAAGLFVLDGRSLAGHSVEPAGSSYECLGCPLGRPMRYLLFPPSEINGALGLPYNRVLAVRPGPAGIEVETVEGLDSYPERAEQSFRFSHAFTLERASQSDSWTAHERLEREGRIRHSVAECPMYRTPPPVRAWDSVNGWRELKPRERAAVVVGPRPAGS